MSEGVRHYQTTRSVVLLQRRLHGQLRKTQTRQKAKNPSATQAAKEGEKVNLPEEVKALIVASGEALAEIELLVSRQEMTTSWRKHYTQNFAKAVVLAYRLGIADAHDAIKDLMLEVDGMMACENCNHEMLETNKSCKNCGISVGGNNDKDVRGREGEAQTGDGS
jgi:hypothetical protein